MEIEPNKQAQAWLERETWRTTQRENRRNYEQQGTAGKWGAILSAIINHQNKNHGLSPPNHIISRDSGLSPGQVQYHLAEMEDRGLITDMKGWPRRIVVKDMAKVASLSIAEPRPMQKIEEARVTNTIKSRGKSAYAYKSFMVRAKEAAQAIMDHHDRFGMAPSTTDIRDALGYHSTAASSRVVNKMVELGWVSHKPRHHHDIVLTGLGRALLFGEVREDVPTNTPVHATNTSRPVTAGRPTPLAAPQISMTTMPFLAPMAEPTPKAAGPVDLSNLDTVDLLLELQSRGLKVSR
jgi:hypothetical protein